MKVKLDDYYVRVLINGLFSHRNDYDDGTNEIINNLLLNLVDISDKMKPNRRSKVEFSPSESIVIIKCLNDWRNEQLREEKFTAAEVIGELLEIFAK